MPLATTLSEVTDAVRDVLVTNVIALGLAKVYYGPEELLPQFPSVLVRSGSLDRTIDATHKWELSLNVIVDLLYGKVQAGETNQYEAEQKADAITTVLHQDHGLGGLVIWSHVTRIQPLTLRRNEVMIRSVELTWTGISRQFF